MYAAEASEVVSKDSLDTEIAGEKNKSSYCSYSVPKEILFKFKKELVIVTLLMLMAFLFLF